LYYKQGPFNFLAINKPFSSVDFDDFYNLSVDFDDFYNLFQVLGKNPHSELTNFLKIVACQLSVSPFQYFLAKKDYKKIVKEWNNITE